ncbi:MAG: hypothetical protein Q9213_008356 [Squamulea squamosa]
MIECADAILSGREVPWDELPSDPEGEDEDDGSLPRPPPTKELEQLQGLIDKYIRHLDSISAMMSSNPRRYGRIGKYAESKGNES